MSSCLWIAFVTYFCGFFLTKICLNDLPRKKRNCFLICYNFEKYDSLGKIPKFCKGNEAYHAGGLGERDRVGKISPKIPMIFNLGKDIEANRGDEFGENARHK